MKLNGLAARIERLEQHHSIDPPFIVVFLRPEETEAQARERTLAASGLAERSRIPVVLFGWEDRNC